MRYFVSHDGREVEVVVDGDRITLDGRTVEATLTPIPGTPLRQLLVGERRYIMPLVGEGQGRWSVGWRGEQWGLEVLDERTRHIRSLTGGGADRAGGGVLRAPMPGLVVRVAVAPGQAVAAGAGVVVLEAMKMENELKAAGPGVVRTVRVEAGMAVEKGQVLVEFDGSEAA